MGVTDAIEERVEVCRRRKRPGDSPDALGDAADVGDSVIGPWHVGLAFDCCPISASCGHLARDGLRGRPTRSRSTREWMRKTERCCSMDARVGTDATPVRFLPGDASPRVSRGTASKKAISGITWDNDKRRDEQRRFAVIPEIP
jgi:hypothetical protein